MCSLACTHWCMQVEVSLEVATLDVSTSLAIALDGGATVLPTSTTVDLLPEVHRSVAGHRRAVLRRRACTWHPRGCLLHGWRTRCRWLAPPLPVWRVDGGDDELVDIVRPLLGC
jgi:hypothetical protein